jgi:hypothetical protein
MVFVHRFWRSEVSRFSYLRVFIGVALFCVAQNSTALVIDSTVSVNGDAFDRSPYDGTFELFLADGGVQLFETRTFRQNRWVLEFTTGSMTTGDTVDSAILDFDFSEILGNVSAVEVHTFAGNGVGEASDAQTLNLLASFAAATGPQSLDVTSHIQASLDAGFSYFGFFFRVITPDNGAILRSGDGASNGSPGLRGEYTATSTELPDVCIYSYTTDEICSLDLDGNPGHWDYTDCNGTPFGSTAWGTAETVSNTDKGLKVEDKQEGWLFKMNGDYKKGVGKCAHKVDGMEIFKFEGFLEYNANTECLCPPPPG